MPTSANPTDRTSKRCHAFVPCVGFFRDSAFGVVVAPFVVVSCVKVLTVRRRDGHPPHLHAAGVARARRRRRGRARRGGLLQRARPQGVCVLFGRGGGRISHQAVLSINWPAQAVVVVVVVRSQSQSSRDLFVRSMHARGGRCAALARREVVYTCARADKRGRWVGGCMHAAAVAAAAAGGT